MSKTKKDIGAILHKDGVSFRVWAPFAKAVAVTGSFNDWQTTPMQSENDGYWFVDTPTAKAGQEYRYLIDTGSQQLFKNDPRALQVTTSAGNSVIVDPEFEWGDDQPVTPSLNHQIVYELHVGTFNRPDPSSVGTLETAMNQLDYLADLGVTTIELMPVCSMSTVREWWGYTPDYLYAVESQYGGRYQLLEFVKAAHARGLSVVLDTVYNHLGPDKSLDLWQFDGWNQEGKGGIYFYNDWRSSTPWGETRPDYGRAEVQQYILDNVRMWLKVFHLDGLRLDSTIFIRNVKGNNNDPDNDIPEGWQLLQKITELAYKINPYVTMIAEDTSGNDYITKPTGDGGAGFRAQWEVTFPHLVREALDGADDANRNIRAISEALGKNYNGDVFQRVIYSDSHDSAANGGARLNEEIAPGHSNNVYARQRSLLAAAMVLTAPGIPMLFQGQEFMQGGSFNDWQALDWTDVEQFTGIVEAYKHLIALRKNAHGNTAGLCGQSIAIKQLDESGKILAYHRWDQGGPNDDVMVVVNFTNQTKQHYKLPFPHPGTWRVRFNSSWHGYSPEFSELEVGDVEVQSTEGVLEIPPYSVLIFSQDRA